MQCPFSPLGQAGQAPAYAQAGDVQELADGQLIAFSPMHMAPMTTLVDSPFTFQPLAAPLIPAPAGAAGPAYQGPPDIAEEPEEETYVPLTELNDELANQNAVFDQMILQKNATIGNLESRIEDYRAAINDVRQKLQDQAQSENQLRLRIAELEKLKSPLVQKLREAGDDGELKTVKKERDRAIRELRELENAYTATHKKYKQIRPIIHAFQKSQKQLEEALREHRGYLKEEEKRYLEFKARVQEELRVVNEALDVYRTQHRPEIEQLQAALTEAEENVDVHEKLLEEKNQEHDELVEIIDELMNEVRVQDGTV